MDPARKRDGREVDQDGAIAKNFESFQRSKVQKALTRSQFGKSTRFFG
jgi:hypothetical protein